MAGKGFTDKGNRITPTSPFDWDTGAKLSAGEGAGTSDTTEETQLLVKIAVESAAEDLAAMRVIAESNTPTSVFVRASEYETVAASQTDQIMGTTGAVGDTIEGILVIPTSTSVGAISIEDGATNIPVYAGGTVDAALKPFFIPLFGIAATTATGWEVTSGGNEALICFGQFT